MKWWRVEDAIRDFQKAVELNPNRASYQLHLNEALKRKKDDSDEKARSEKRKRKEVEERADRERSRREAEREKEEAKQRAACRTVGLLFLFGLAAS